MLKAIRLDPPLNQFAHGWWTVNGKKMSKSIDKVVEPNLLIDQFGVDAIRYFLLREVPFGLDGDFSHKSLINRINSDLANNLGNLLNRTMSMIKRYHDQMIPAPTTPTEDFDLIDEFKKGVEDVHKLYDDLSYNKILERIWLLVDTTNKYIDTPQGVFELKFFFHSGIKSYMGNAMSSISVKNMIKEIINKEDGEKPLTDDQMVKALMRKNAKIARRTITKYRKELNIPPASKRKKLF